MGFGTEAGEVGADVDVGGDVTVAIVELTIIRCHFSKALLISGGSSDGRGLEAG